MNSKFSYTLLMFFILIGTSSCEKRILDHRNKYVGDWSLHTVETHTVNYIPSPNYGTTVTEYDQVVRVFYEKGKDNKGIILFQYGTSDPIEYEISNSGYLDSRSRRQGQFFSKDSLRLTNGFSSNYSYWYSETIGTKIK